MPEYPDPSGVSLVPALLDALDLGIVAFDRSWTYRFVNKAAADFLQTTPEALLGHEYHELYPEAQGSPFQQAYARVMATGVGESLDDYYEPWQRYFRNRVLPTPDGILILFEDVTEQRIQSARQERSRALLQQVIDFAPVWIALSDRNSRPMLVNRFAASRFGLTPAEMVQQPPRELLPDRIVDRIQAAQRRARHTVNPQQLDIEVEVPDGPARIYQIVVFPTFAEDGVLTGTGTVGSDVTGRVRAERALRETDEQRRALLERLTAAEEQERARIAADVHDDPVQALAAVDLRLGLLHRRLGESAPDLLPLVEQVQESVGSASDRLRELLFDLEPSAADTPLVDGIREVAAHLLGEPAPGVPAIGWQLEVEPPDAPDKVDLAPPERIKAIRIVKEALRNIREHAGASAVHLGVRAVRGGVEVQIVDDGIGIAPGQAVSPPGHRGLTSMRDHAAVAGGRLDIDARVGGGTLVRFWLPTTRQQYLAVR